MISGDDRDLSPSVGSQVWRLARLARKEISDILRDRRTIITLVLMPLLLYPLMTVALQQFFLTNVSTETKWVFKVGFRSESEGKWIERHLREGLRLLAASSGVEDRKAMRYVLEFVVADNLEEEIRHGGIHLGIRPRPMKSFRFADGHEATTEWELLYPEDSTYAQEGVVYLEKLSAAANGHNLRLILERVKFPPIAVQLLPTIVTTPEGGRPFSLAAMVPLVLILMTITGAVYPAIDLTAGERERGTLEILIAAPIPRLGLLFAKYVSVLTVALLTAVVNLATMTVTLRVTGLSKVLFGPAGLSVLVVVQILGLLLLFAAFFSAVLLALTSFARSFKEAQAYLIPLMLVSIAPGLIALMPGLELSGGLLVTPLLNVVLLARDLFEGKAHWAGALIVIFSTLLYALAALSVAARIFGAEAVLYSETGGWRDLFRRPKRPQSAVTLAGALLCTALMFPTKFFLTAAAGQAEDLTIRQRLLAAILLNAILFAGFPLAAAALGRVRLASAFPLPCRHWLAFPAAVLLGLSVWPLLGVVLEFFEGLGGFSKQSQFQEYLAKLLEAWRQVPMPILIGVMAVLPALVEEMFFRGYLFGALEASRGGRTAVIVSAMLFGAFHVTTGAALSPERFLTTALLGLLLGWMRWRTGSLLPGMLFHACHNGAVVAAAATRWEFPRAWLPAAAAAAAAGALLMHFCKFPWPLGAVQENRSSAGVKPPP